MCLLMSDSQENSDSDNNCSDASCRTAKHTANLTTRNRTALTSRKTETTSTNVSHAFLKGIHVQQWKTPDHRQFTILMHLNCVDFGWTATIYTSTCGRFHIVYHAAKITQSRWNLNYNNQFLLFNWNIFAITTNCFNWIKLHTRK